LEIVAALAAQDNSHFVSSTPDLSVVQLLTDKKKFYEKLADIGIPHPFTAQIRSIDDLDTIDDRCFEHAFLKPRNSQKFFRAFRVKALKTGSRKKAKEQYQRVRTSDLSVMLQEFIPGPADQHYFIDGFINRSGKPKGLFARRRLRINPPDFGNSSFMRSVAVEDVRPAWESLRDLLDKIGYRGIFSAEFKKDPRDNVFKLLEVNARPWWYIEFAASCGVNVAKMAYMDALGEDVAPQMEYPTGIGCVYPYFDLDPCREAYRRGELSASEWLRSWITSRQAVMSITDPLPTVAFCLWLAKLKLKQILSR
jgi:predicted ATP-grasp superfamily ATP-dependent carboligase